MVLETILDRVAEQFLLDRDSISADTAFAADLGADSLDVVELAMTLEEEFSLPDTPEDAISEIVTIGDLAAYVTKAMGSDD